MRKRKSPTASAPEEHAAAAGIEREDGEDGSGAQQAAISVRKEGSGALSSVAIGRPLPQSHRELALEIFAACDPVAVGRDVLEKAGDKCAATKLRALEIFAEWAYGKPSARESVARVTIIWDIPVPAYRAAGPERQNSEGGRK